MTTKAIVFAVAAVCLGSASSAFAQQYGGDYRSQRDGQVQRDNRYDRDSRYDNDHRDDHRRDHTERQREGRQEPVYGSYSRRGAGPRNDLYQGRRLPGTYYSDRYVVSDWHRYNLSAPPRGTHWVRAGNDYVLVALATGIIAQVLLNN